jgi:type III restriction enzyme
MKIELKPFQEQAADDVLSEIGFARREIAGKKNQAIILSAPTGSGKTVVLTQVLERVWKGDSGNLGDKKAVFLWLSDSPELNLQSRDKIALQSSVFREADLQVIEPSFSEERLTPGIVYFLNTQKLGKGKDLISTSDERQWTLWQTIENTIKAGPEHLYLIIDEAHRGTQEGRSRTEATSIMQRFVKGYTEGGMSPAPLIIGMSATPERFSALIEGQSRTKRTVDVNPLDVRASGLLKDRIVLQHPKMSKTADWSLLEAAAERWKGLSEQWKKYCKSQNIDRIVEPVLVIQVEDGTQKQFTKTDLSNVIKIVERVTGKLPDAAWAHAFMEDKEMDIDGKKIRKIEASKIENDGVVRVVLFKMSLTTGWDCPRAEVMMSFRRAVDSTLIAQLVGRMVRTPLARRIEGSEALNSVHLYLPHYEEDEVQKIIKRLQSRDPEEGVAVEVVDGDEMVDLTLDETKKACVELYQRLPSYAVERIPKMSDIRRLMKLSRNLDHDEIGSKTEDTEKDCIVAYLKKELTRLKKQKQFQGNMQAGENITVMETWVDLGAQTDVGQATVTIKATPENIEDLFDRSGRSIGEGLHEDLWRALEGTDAPLQNRLAVAALLMEKDVMDGLEQICNERLQTLWKKHDKDIRNLPTGEREAYRLLKKQAKNPESFELLLPTELQVKLDGNPWQKHIYIDSKGHFSAALNRWESKVVETVIEPDKMVVGWLRIIPRKDWALCIPYEQHNVDHPLYPDIVVFRKEKGELVADILDPHGTHLDEAVAKAKGLAAYARKHGEDFGRIELMILDKDDHLQRLNLNDEKTREKVDRVTSREQLELLFEEWGQ